MRILLFQKNPLDLAANFSQLVSDFFAVIPNVIGALVIFIIGYLIAKIVAGIIRRALKTIGVDLSLIHI